MDEKTYTLKQVSGQLGIPVYTVRRLCNAGLVVGIRRNRNGYRVLNEEQVNELGMFVKLLRAELTMGELKKYARLQRQGGKTLQERKGMLETQRRQLWLKIQELQEGIGFIERMMEILDESANP